MIFKTISPGLADDVWFEDVEDESATGGTKDFNPNQPRDPHTGEWIKVPGGGDVLPSVGDQVRTPGGETGTIVNVAEPHPVSAPDGQISVMWEGARGGRATPYTRTEFASKLRHGWTHTPGSDVADFAANGWSTSAADAVESARKAHGVPQARRFEVSVNGVSMQGESRDFADTVDAVVRAHDQGESDVKVMVKRGVSLTQEPSAEDHAAILEGATAVLSRRTAKDDPQSSIQNEASLLASMTTHKLSPAPTISPEVQNAVTDRATAIKFVKDKTGIDLKFDEYDAPKGFWQEIAQSVSDTTKRFPVLTEGGKYGRLTRIGLASELPQPHSAIRNFSGADSPGNWAITSFDVSKSHSLGVHTSIPSDYPKAGADAWITLFDHPGDADAIQPVTEGSTMDESYGEGMAAQPTRWVYGRLMHEMGHATSEMSGEANAEQPDRSLDDHNGVNPADTHYAGQTVAWLEQIDLMPSDVTTFSAYAASSPVESWAEIFVILNAAHGMDNLNPSVKAKLLHLQQIANDWAKANKVPGGRIL